MTACLKLPDSDKNNPMTARVVNALTEIDPQQWNDLAHPPLMGSEGRSEGRPYHPFIGYNFLTALERAGTLAPETGWMPYHIVVEQTDKLVAAMPLYLKAHSQGEYIFDHGWAVAYEQAGGRYYPKALSAIPFTPVTGPRLLAKNPAAREALIESALHLVEKAELSSLHVNFISEQDARFLGSKNFLLRTGLQYHWQNQGYQSWDDFSASLASRKRKALRRERQCLKDNGLTVEWITGSDIKETHLDHFWEFYQDTSARKWGVPYLNRQAFSLLAQNMSTHLLFIFAKRDENYIAGTMSFIGGDRLYGRYWGCKEYVPHLHFELCYYQAIDFALAHDLQVVEAGAQGEHKIARGYAPVITRSAHYIFNSSLRTAIAHFLTREGQAIAEEAKILSTHTPFKKDPS